MNKAINTNKAMNGNNTTAHAKSLYPFLHKLSNTIVQNNTYNILKANNTKLLKERSHEYIPTQYLRESDKFCKSMATIAIAEMNTYIWAGLHNKL